MCSEGTVGSFNPRPRAGGDFNKNKQCRDGHVSIHAPARGATAYLDGVEEPRVVSIHAPARGATFNWPAI